jgi:hypothetical protein
MYFRSRYSKRYPLLQLLDLIGNVIISYNDMNGLVRLPRRAYS